MRLKYATWVVGPVLLLSSSLLAETTQPSGFPKSHAELGISPRADVGSVAAGTICLPKGRVHVADFAPDDATIDLALLRRLRNPGSKSAFPSLFDSVLEIRVRLVSIDGKFCNKSYGPLGLGNTKAFVGKLNMAFEWEVVSENNGSLKGMSVIVSEYKKKDAKSYSEMLDLALNSLLERVSEIVGKSSNRRNPLVV